MKKMQAIGAAAAAASLLLASCGERRPAPVSEVVAVRAASVAVDPSDPTWAELPAFRAALLLQDLVEPRLLTASTASVEVRAMSDGTRIAFRLAWSDSTDDDLPGSARFPDACAVQVPAATGPDLPAPQMGEANRPVEIAYWRASWQASRNGREDAIQSLYPNAHPDHYPFEAPPLQAGTAEQAEASRRYAPARALGNFMEGPRESAVEDLIAEGPGTLRRADEQRSTGLGLRSGDGWAVVIVRPLPPDLPAAGRGEVAFAVWNGAKGETGSRKMRTGWVPLAAREEK
jgi:hypothetical protein